MARTSAVGYIGAIRQTALGVPETGTAGFTFFRFLSAPKGSAEMTNNRYREGGGGRDITLSLKEGIKHSIEFPMFARPTIMGFLLSAGTGSSAAGTFGGGTTSNGLVKPPKLGTTNPANGTLAASYKAGETNLTVTGNPTNTFTSKKVVIGWGPNMEFATLITGGSTSLAVLDAPGTLFPHAKGEPIYEVDGYGTLTNNEAIGSTTIEVSPAGAHGLAGTAFSVIGNSTSGALGSEWGAAEILGSASISGDAISCSATRNGHSAGCWVYMHDAAVTNSSIHGFEPISSLTGSLDYFTLERTVTGADSPNSVIERLQDAKLATMELSGESPGPLRIQVMWQSRFGTKRDEPMAESYTNQSSTDLPFRMPNGKFLIQFGSSTSLSTKLRQFTWNFSNITADDIYTDDIATDDILDLARESNFSAQFYFESSAEYYEIIYGSATPTEGDRPTANQVAGSVILDFTISAEKRMSIFIPSVTWENFPVEVDPEPKPIIIEATGVPLKQPGQPLYSICVQNADTAIY